ncbi:unnamed protein product [Protopolystoma xenopodis]|uniref:Uncharacterized protein n=1 Tax=Protopolystoma xenopodis TaxID=117903 RepID=A0A448WXD0_9PLAT|nr:unnamed protein product [Protopolystoma xenopodis]
MASGFRARQMLESFRCLRYCLHRLSNLAGWLRVYQCLPIRGRCLLPSLQHVGSTIRRPPHMLMLDRLPHMHACTFTHTYTIKADIITRFSVTQISTLPQNES